MDSCNRNCVIKVRTIVGHLEEIMDRIIDMPNWRRAVLAVASAVGLLGISNAATAEDWYVEVGFGQSEVVDFGCGSPLFATCSADDTDSSYSIHGGYRFHENMAVEFGYTYLGSAKADGTLPPAVPFNADFESWAYDVTAVGTWPVSERISVFGRIGFANWKREADIFIGGGVGFTSMSDSGTDPVYGFGAEFAAHEQVAVRLQWQRFSDVGGDDTGESDIDVISVNAVIPLRKTTPSKQESKRSDRARQAEESVTEQSQTLTLQKTTTGPTDANAQFKLGHAYSIGQGVSKDYAKALKWYRAAASQGHARAQFNLGAAYANGSGVKADKETAMDWFFEAGQSFISEGKRDLALRTVATMKRVVPGHPLSTQLQAAIRTQFGQ